MTEYRMSRTAILVAAYRARASARVDPICHDPWAAALAGAEGEALAREYDRTFPHMELWIAIRTAWIDGWVLRGCEHVRQVVVMGAGLDARAARLARTGARFFELDQPASQVEKIRRVRAVAGYPQDAATYVSCDFEREDFMTRLAEHGFDPTEPAMFVWEGVSYYLTEAAVRATLRRVAEACHPSSAIVFDYVRAKFVAGDVRKRADLAPREFVADLGEPLKFGTNDALPLLYAEGFRRVRTLNFDEACLNLTGTYERERQFRFQGLALASRDGFGAW